MKVVCSQKITIDGKEFLVKNTYKVSGKERFIGDYGLQHYYLYPDSNGSHLVGSEAFIALPEDFFIEVNDQAHFNTKDALTSAYDNIGKVTNNIEDFKQAYSDLMGIDITPDNYKNVERGQKAEVGLPSREEEH